ncbi:MATE family efflux transporter [Cetobacterium somerae]|uniref:MATE family efflux transporter n=1 Tax=Cetobacterium sp. NK01 TaxID=2993530 RepID=UPI002115DD87|nr:MATE family efflux transporter [Cetobacterium sp. NK01]MCQ8211772.1 MATE family efflux transporter [Cetobacterium sp. NK01]
MQDLSLKFEKQSTLSTILKFSIPSSFGAIIGMLCVLTDRYFIGQVAGREGMAAVALVFPYAMIINSFNFAFSGIAIIVGVKLGSKDRTGAEKVLCTGFLWIFIVGILLTLFLFLFNIPILKILGASSSNIPFAIEYTNFLIPIATFQIILGQSTLIRGIGDSVTAMGVNIFTGLFNVVLDYIFIMKLNMGIGGAALATLISTALSAFYVLFYFYKSDVISFSKDHLSLNIKILKEIFKIGSPRFYNQLLQSSVITVTNRQAGVYGGDIATAAIGIISICRSVMNTSLQGFNQGTAAIISYTFGSKNYSRVKEVLKIQLYTVVSVSTILVLLMLFYTNEIVSFFIKDDLPLVKFTVSAMRLNLFLMPFTAIFLACNNFFQSIKDSVIATRFFMLRIIILNIPLVYILGYFFNEIGVWLAFPISDTLVAIVMFFLTVKKIRKISPDN